MKTSFLETLQQYPWRQKAMEVLYETPIEIYIGAALVGTLSGGIGYYINAERANKIPVAFSEVGKTIKEFNRLGKPVPPLTKFYATTSDATMKVFEAHNEARQTSSSNETFARELEVKTDPALRIHRQLSAYAKDAPEDSRAALQSLEKLTQAAADLPPVITALAAAWDDTHQDVYRTEYYTENQCDTNGCRSVTNSRSVYDHTIHSYTYHPQEGEAAARLMGAFLAKHPDLNIDERLVFSTRTDAENEYAIEKSMKVVLEGKIPTQEQALMYANMWASGSNFMNFLPVVTANHAALVSNAAAWNAAKSSAQDDSYTTYSSADDGPKEFQVAEKALANAQTINESIHKMTDGIAYAGSGVPALEAKVKEFIGVTLDGKPGDSDQLRDDVMQLATGIYKANFENGLDVRPFKIEEVLLFALGGLLAGGLAGAGVDRLLDYRRQRRFGALSLKDAFNDDNKHPIFASQLPLRAQPDRKTRAPLSRG